MSVTRAMPRYLAWLTETGALPRDVLGAHEDVVLARVIDALGDVRLRRDGARWEAFHGLLRWAAPTKLEAALGILAIVTRLAREGEMPPEPRRHPRIDAEPEIERQRRLVG